MATPHKRSRRPKPLSPKARRFVAEYLIDFNGAHAAVRAGYSVHTARVQASQLLSNVKVAAAVQKGLDRQLRSCDLSIERIIRQLAMVAYFDPKRMFDEHGQLLPIHEMPPEIRHGLPGIDFMESRTTGDLERSTVVRRFHLNRGPAIIALAKHLQVFTRSLGDKYPHALAYSAALPDLPLDELDKDYDDDDENDDDETVDDAANEDDDAPPDDGDADDGDEECHDDLILKELRKLAGPNK